MKSLYVPLIYSFGDNRDNRDGYSIHAGLKGLKVSLLLKKRQILGTLFRDTLDLNYKCP